MQDIVFYVDASNSIGTVTNITNNGNGYAPPLVFGVSVCLKMRLFATSVNADAYPISSFSDVTHWAWRMDSEFNRRTPYKVNADNANISVQTVTETVNGKTMHFTEFAIPISDMNTQELADWLGDNKEQQAKLTGELVGYDSSGNAIFGLQVDGFAMRNKLADRNEPTSNDQEYLTRSETEQLVQTEISSAAAAKQDKLTSANAGAGIAISSGGTISMACAILGATNGVKIADGKVQFDPETAVGANGSTRGAIVSVSDGLLVTGGTAGIDDASVEDVLVGIEGGTASINDKVVTPGNLRGALSIGQAVDVSCAPPQNTVTPQDASLGFLGTMIWTGNINTSSVGMGWTGAGVEFPKFAAGLTYLLVFDIKNIDTQERAWTVRSYGSTLGRGVPNIELQYGQSTRLWSFSDVAYNMGAIVASRTAYGATTYKFEITNWRVYEVTALTWDAVMYLAQLPDPDAFFRSTSVFQVRDKYLVKQDMVCPWIYTIGMPDNSDLTVAAGLSYRIKYTNDNAHKITVDTIPADAYGWDTHIQMFIKGASSVVFEHPLILMNALTPNAGHNLVVKYRNGDALVYVDDTNAGSIVISTSGTTAGTLNYYLQQDPGSGQDNYIIFAATTDGLICDAGTVSVAYNTDIIGNGTDKTAITGTLSVAGNITMNAQSLMITGSTINGPANANVVLDNVVLDNTTVDMKNIYFKTVVIPAGSTVYRMTSDAVILTEGTNISGGGTLDLCLLPAIYRNSATATLRMSDISVVNGYRDSSRTVGGLYFYTNGIVSIANCYFSNMSGTYGGAAQFNNTPSEISGCTFTQCNAGIGPAIYYVGNTHTLTDCVITGNTGNYQHSISLTGATGRLFMSNCVVTGNTRSQSSTGSCNISVDAGSELTITGSTVDEYLSASTSKLNIEGYNHFLGHVRASGDTSVVTVRSGSIIDFTDAIEVGGYAPGIVTYSQKPLYVFGDNITIVKIDGGTVAFDAWTGNTSNSVYASGIITFSEITITGSTVDPWKAENVTFYSKIDAHEVNTMKLTNDTFARGSLISDPPMRIQLPAGTTVSMSGNTNSSDTKILQAPVIVVGNNAASPSGSATIINAAGASSTVSGIGTYIDKEGDNDFTAISNVKTVTVASGASTAAGTLASAFANGSGSANRWVKVSNGLAASASYPDGAAVIDKKVITAEYEPVFGGDFSFSSGAVVTVDEATKTTTVTGAAMVMSNVEIPPGATVCVSGGGLAAEYVNGNRGTIELVGSNAFRMTSGTIGRVIISSGAIVDIASGIVPGGSIVLYGGASLSPTTIVCGGSSRIFEDVEIHGSTISSQGIIYGATVYSDVGDDHYVHYTEDDGATSSSVIVTGATEYVVPGGLVQVSGT